MPCVAVALRRRLRSSTAEPVFDEPIRGNDEAADPPTLPHGDPELATRARARERRADTGARHASFPPRDDLVDHALRHMRAALLSSRQHLS